MALIRDIGTKPWSKSSVSCGDARAAVEEMELHRRKCINHERHENTRKGETDKHKQILIGRVPIDKWDRSRIRQRFRSFDEQRLGFLSPARR